MDSHLDDPDLPGKGEKAGRCNRKVCQQEGAVFQHIHSGSWYCTHCAMKINRCASDAGEQSLCYPDKQAMEKFLNESTDKDCCDALRIVWKRFFNL